MNKLILFIFFLTFTTLSAQDDVFSIARTGTVAQMEQIYKKSPELINTKNEYGYSPFLVACYNGNSKMVEFLVDKIEDINGISKYGTPLMAAVYKRDEAIVDILLKNGADANKGDDGGTTALHYATLFNSTSIAEKLINAGAKANVKDKSGKTAYEYAMSYKNQKIITLIKNKAL
ncbi:MAG: ankyrin repeat domain-containing protein [Bacteroidota bacterium]